MRRNSEFFTVNYQGINLEFEFYNYWLHLQSTNESELICNDLLSSIFSGNHHKLIFSCFWRHLKRASEYQFPALATLIYVDWLPTGQWSAVSSTVYSRGSQITLCRHSSLVDSSNLEMAEALSRCLQLLLLLLARCMWRKPSYICLSTHHNSGMMMSRLRSTALAAWPWY